MIFKLLIYMNFQAQIFYKINIIHYNRYNFPIKIDIFFEIIIMKIKNLLYMLIWN